MKNLLLGLLGGISLGLLFAPQKGKDFRKNLSKSNEKIQDFAKEFLAAGKEASDEVQKLLKSKQAKEILQKGKTHLDELITAGEKLSVQGKKELQKMVKKVKGTKKSLTEEVKDFFEEKKKK